MIYHTMKIWERTIDRRLREETNTGDELFGFMPGRGTTGAIFAARQVIEKDREMQKELHTYGIRQGTATGSMEEYEGAGCS